MKKLSPEVIAVALISLVFCQFKWTGAFSYEFSFFIGLAMFFLAFSSTILRHRHATLSFVSKCKWIIHHLCLLLIPLGIVLLYSLKHGICSFQTGMKWFFLLPVVTTIFAACSAFFGLSCSTSKTWGKILLGLSPTILFSLLTLRDLYSDPPLSFLHPVLGYFPGPMYDEWIPMFTSLFTYRVWIIAFSFFLLTFHAMKKHRWLMMLLVLHPFIFRNSLEWHHSHKNIQKTLGSNIQSKHSRIYFKENNIASMRTLADSVDFYLEYLSKKMDVSLPSEKIRIYVYPDEYQKKKLTGTANTLVGNPMQRTLHILPTQASDTILIHELSHVVAAPMGIPFLKISPRISLLEGLATAMQPSHLDMSIHEWAKSMLDLGKLPDIESSLNAFSFWKENPVRVYFAAGSFTQWLIDAYGIDRFKKVYLGKSFEKSYEKPLQDLIGEWKTFLTKISVPPSFIDLADYFFSQKPFHEKKCAHEVAEAEMRFSTCNQKNQDCRKFLDRACNLDPENPMLRLKSARYAYRITQKVPDMSMIPLPSAGNSRIQNNLIQLLNDDFHRIQRDQESYDLGKYDYPSPTLINAILTRIYLAKHSPDVLNAIILGNYVPDTNLTWNKNDANYTQAMLYFAKLATQEHQPHKAIEFLSKIDLKNEDQEFKLDYWGLRAQSEEMISAHMEALQAYIKMETLSMTDGEKSFADLQIQRLKYVLNQ
ncbi:MAG: hypothetical protein R2877_08355 [Bdellovibrionota bacterium]